MLKITIKVQENKDKKTAKLLVSYPTKEDYEKATKIEKMSVATVQAKLNSIFED